MAGRKKFIDSDKDKFENSLKVQWVAKAIEMLKDGKSNAFIREHILKNKKGSTSKLAIDSIMTDVNRIFTNSQFAKVEEIKARHIPRYRATIKRLLEVKDADDLTDEETDGWDWERVQRARERKIKAYMDCIETHRLLEELLQFHNKGFVIEWDVQTTTEIKDERTPRVNIEKLSLEDQITLYNLMKEAKKTDNELLAITQAETTDVTVTEDVEHEIVERAVVEDIKIEKLPAPPYRSPITASDPTIKLRESLKQLAAKRFVEAGGTLDEDEKKFLNK